jgi:hypothetical protein
MQLHRVGSALALWAEIVVLSSPVGCWDESAGQDCCDIVLTSDAEAVFPDTMEIVTKSSGGAPCATSAECNTGVCLRVTNSHPSVGECAYDINDCPPEWNNRFWFGGKRLCTPPAPPDLYADVVCASCSEGCDRILYAEAYLLEVPVLDGKCVSGEGLQRFCTVACEKESCPAGTQCVSAWSVETMNWGWYCQPEVGCPLEPRKPGAACGRNKDCNSGWCVGVAALGDDNKICSLHCVQDGECGPPERGYRCKSPEQLVEEFVCVHSESDVSWRGPQ